MLKPQSSEPDFVVARRFEQLCNFLSANADLFEVGSFAAPSAAPVWQTPAVGAWATGRRYAEQLRRRVG
jgi:hypothetical protein